MNNVKEVRVPLKVVSSSSRLYSCVACTKTMYGLYGSLCNIACKLLTPCCHDDYFLYSVILPVHHIHFLNSCKSTLFDIDLVFKMSQGTRGQLGRNQGRDDPEGSGLPPPPTMAQVLMEVERNRRDSHALLEVIARNTTQQRNKMVSLKDFIQIHPSVFSYSTEPLDADDWFR